MRRFSVYFTMVELLVVMSVIAILASILLPALTQARRKAKSVHCINSQKQVAAAFMLYAADFDGFGYGGPEWGAVMLPESIVAPYRDTGIAWDDAPRGQGYLRGEDLLFCPTEKLSTLNDAESYGASLSSLLGGPTPFRFTTIGTVKNPDQDSPPLPIPFKLYISPSCSVLGGDSAIIAPISNDQYCYFSGITNNESEGTRFCHIDMRHNKNANVFMADGHVTNVGRELKECYFYNVRNSIHSEEKFTFAIQNKLRYKLE
ncbi:MAG: prepilin-type N-terminal cleavage/methylation domain-containing protein [Victivallales bacterium]|nr:prepilin-type N-terminal cleavage/methylation domain-containing protein [Victivallales bacterium]